MRTRELGRGGPVVSLIGLGCNNFGRRIGEDATRAVVDAALDAGITLFDTADVYGTPRGESETLLGRVLQGRRDRIVLATKFGNSMEDGSDDATPRGSRAYIRRAVEASLRRLQTDWIDLYQYHRPDGVTPIEETLGALDELVREGKVRHIGSSNFEAELVERADAAARERGGARFVSAQNQYSLLERDAELELLPACERLGIGFLPYFPLASGLLTGKYRRGEPPPPATRLSDRPIGDETFDRLEPLEHFAEGHGRTLLELAFAGLAAHPAVASVIAGAMRPEQVRANVRAGDWELSEHDLAELHAALESVPASRS